MKIFRQKVDTVDCKRVSPNWTGSYEAAMSPTPLILIVYGFVILLSSSSSVFAESTLDVKNKQSQTIGRYNYSAVCLFIDFMKSKLHQPTVSNLDQSSNGFKYEKNGVTGFYSKKMICL